MLPSTEASTFLMWKASTSSRVRRRSVWREMEKRMCGGRSGALRRLTCVYGIRAPGRRFWEKGCGRRMGLFERADRSESFDNPK